ncbi:MAG: hypothetical protein MI754_11790 [Chromatiales bacterium]|nr:hypothetical protein [Chromatiales bacterium]
MNREANRKLHMGCGESLRGLLPAVAGKTAVKMTRKPERKTTKMKKRLMERCQ